MDGVDNLHLDVAVCCLSSNFAHQDQLGDVLDARRADDVFHVNFWSRGQQDTYREIREPCAFDQLVDQLAHLLRVCQGTLVKGVDENDRRLVGLLVSSAETEWIEENGADATAEDFEEQKEKLSNVAYPITSKMYQGAGGEKPEEEGEFHDEL